MLKRNDILEQKEKILEMIENNETKGEMCRYFNCQHGTLNNVLKELNISYKGNQPRKGKEHLETRKDINIYLNNLKYITSYKLKLLLFREKIKEKVCESCGLTQWLSGDIPLELHHIDGNRFNNSLENLQILCPNCHTFTETYKTKNCKFLKDK